MKKEENSTELQKPNVEVEVYDSKKKKKKNVSEEKEKKKKKLKSLIGFLVPIKLTTTTEG